MTAIEFMHSLSNLKYLGTFDYIEDKADMIKRIRVIYSRTIYFLKDI